MRIVCDSVGDTLTHEYTMRKLPLIIRRLHCLGIFRTLSVPALTEDEQMVRNDPA